VLMFIDACCPSSSHSCRTRRRCPAVINALFSTATTIPEDPLFDTVVPVHPAGDTTTISILHCIPCISLLWSLGNTE
jgi:hypothetical protein